jgi:lysozyme
MSNNRVVVSALALSAAAFIALVGSEGYTDKAVIPTKGDRPTVGFGSTFRDDGSPVKLGDTITPPKAMSRALTHIQKDEGRLKKCVTGPVNQDEYDILLDFSYQYGTETACKSSMVRYINAGQYAQACESYLLYKRAAGFDCSTPGNTRCAGVWRRSQERHAACVAGL